MSRRRFHPGWAISALARRLMRSAALRASTKTEILGMEVLNADDSEDSEMLFELVGRALRLIKDADARRFTRVQRDLSKIVIVGYPGSSYWPELRACALSRVTLEQQSTAWVASVVLHEACHGRLHRAGIEYQSSLRVRMERTCIREQERFLKKLPDTAQLRAHLAAQVEVEHGASDHSRERRSDQLEALGVPRWLARRM